MHWAVVRSPCNNTNKFTGIYIRQPEFIRMKTNLAAGGIRTAGSDEHNQPQQHCASGCVAHAWRVGASVGTMGSVHVVCCVPGICLSCVLTAHESLGEKTDNIYLPIRTYKM